MDTKDLAKRLSLLSEQLDHMRQEMDELIDIWGQVLVKNQDLQMENHYLRERVNQLNNEEGEEKGKDLPPNYGLLLYKIYSIFMKMAIISVIFLTDKGVKMLSSVCFA